MTHQSDQAPTVAIVLSGAAARGAFQAGALAEIVPALTAAGERPTVWLGTSAGSINTALWGARAHLAPEVAAKEVLDIWRAMSDDDVFAPLLPLALPRVAAQYAAGAVLGVGRGTSSLLDTSPLARTGARVLDLERLADNLAQGHLAAAGVVATRVPTAAGDVPGAASGRSVLFLDETSPSSYAGDANRALDVHRGALDDSHILASAAIPVAFPAVQVAEPTAAGGWYVDGGVRLNAPLHPAVGLGATKVVVVSATSTTYGTPPAPDPEGERPDIADAGAQVLNAVLGDRMVEDLLALRRTNRLVAQSASPLTTRSGRPYRHIPSLAVAPPPGEMGRIAGKVFAERTRGLGRIRELDNWLLGRALRGAGDSVGRRELLSFLFFDEEYFSAGIELGRQSARAALANGWEG